MERRLAAILAADVVGYTALMGRDEVGTLARMTALRVEVLEPLITEYRGRIFKLMGDGMLVELTSVVDAVGCAQAWQEATLRHEAKADADQRLRFRIGINLGDVIVEGDDVHGDGVNIASRLEGLAEPGGICLSEDCCRHAKAKIDARFEGMGEQTLKNVADSVRVYSVAARQSAATAPSLAVEPLPLTPTRLGFRMAPCVRADCCPPPCSLAPFRWSVGSTGPSGMETENDRRSAAAA